MWKPLGIALCLISPPTLADGRLTTLENEWLKVARPVLNFAEAQALPVDIIVQPRPTAGSAPVAMGFDGSRCKLVLSLRNNPSAETVLGNVASDQRKLLIEAMVAHELAHCWRHLREEWHTLPAGFVAPDTAAEADADTTTLREQMRETRLEEAFADLFGLAWTLKRHPQQYAKVHAWFMQVRDNPAVPQSHHDTGMWIEMAADPAAFDKEATLFEQAEALWKSGITAES